MTTILVLGSTGNIGWPLVQLLAKTPDVTVVAGVHHTPTRPCRNLGWQRCRLIFFGPRRLPRR